MILNASNVNVIFKPLKKSKIGWLTKKQNRRRPNRIVLYNTKSVSSGQRQPLATRTYATSMQKNSTRHSAKYGGKYLSFPLDGRWILPH